VLHDVFGDSSRALLEHAAAGPGSQIVDLGCGPGHTTALLAELFPRARVTGIDRSPRFVELARQAYGDRARFVVGDVTDDPRLPPARVVHARLLLAHLPDVAGLIDRWCGWTDPEGSVVLDEPEAIHTDDPLFEEYLELTEALVADRGASMYAGPRIDAALSGRRDVRLNRVWPCAVSVGDAARMFSLNVIAWRDDPFIRSRRSEAEIERLHSRLVARLDDPTLGVIDWELRQVILGGQ
jgi:SAM-dependent methyltransferase